MPCAHVVRAVVIGLAVLLPGGAAADIEEVARCQKRFAREGAKFAKRVISSTLKCTTEVTDCQIQCEQGVFGPPCDTNPPPCCDPDDTGSNAAFAACMAEAQATCDNETAKIAAYEINKVNNVRSACLDLTLEELCGAQTEGLNFAALNAGCLALNPGYTCTLDNLIGCVGGPLERALLDQISAVLHPRSSDAVAALGLTAQFPDIPVTRKVKEDLPEGMVDLWAFSGRAGDEVIVRVKTRDDNGNATSNLHPAVTLLDSDQMTVIADTAIDQVPCNVANVCSSTCPQFRRRLPFTRTYFMAVRAVAPGACTGGKYRLVVTSPGGQVPVLIADDANLPTP